MAAARIKYVFSKYPIMANSITYGILYTGAEFSQQTYNKKIAASPKQDYDVKAIARYATFGTTIQANTLYQWYRWLDSKYVGTTFKIIVKKMALDQFILTPPLIAAFYVCMNIMEGKTNVFEECKTKLIPTFMTSCAFWLPAQGLNFLLIPPAARVVYVGCCAFLWVNIICWFKRQDYSDKREDNPK